MSTKLATILADFTTNLASALAVGGTSATLQSATDDDGVALPAGTYFFTIDGENSSKEHIVCTLSGTSITAISSVSRQGVETSGVVRSHRIGATVSLTDFGHILFMNNLLRGVTTFDASTPLGYDGTASITTQNQFATKAYADALAIAGAPNASTAVQGLVQEATQAQIDARTATGGTGAKLFGPLDKQRSTLLSDYVASDTGSANAFAIAPSPVFTALAAGQRFVFKAANANTAAATLAVNGLTAKTIKKAGTLDLAANDIVVGQIVEVLYDGTNMQMLTPVSSPIATGSVMAFAGVTAPTGFLLCDASAVSRSTYAALFALLNPSLGTVTVTLASPGVFSLTAHGLVEGDMVFLTTTGALPTGLSANTLYYVIAAGLTANAFELSATRGGAAINTSVSQSGVHTLWRTLHGLGDGSTTFNVPSLKGKVIVGRDASDTQFAYGETGGEKTHTLITAEMPAHTHNMTKQNAGSGSGISFTGGSNTPVDGGQATQSTGGDGAHNNLQPYNSMHYIIKT